MFFNNSRYYNIRYSGFTLVEVLVVIAVISVLLAVALSNFPEIRLQSDLSNVTYRFAQDLRRTQDMALSSLEYIDSDGVPHPVSGYGIYINLTPNNINLLDEKSYLIYADAVPGNQSYYSEDYIVQRVDFSSTEPGIVIKEINTSGGTQSEIHINFNPFDPAVTIVAVRSGTTFSSVDIVFALESDVTKTRTVSVNRSGLIEVR